MLCIAGGDLLCVAPVDRRGKHSDELGERVLVKPRLDLKGGNWTKEAHGRSRGVNSRCKAVSPRSI